MRRGPKIGGGKLGGGDAFEQKEVWAKSRKKGILTTKRKKITKRGVLNSCKKT